MKEKEITRYYCNGKNNELKERFFNRQNSELELQKENELTAKILSFYQKVYDNNLKHVNINIFNFDFNGYGYIEDFGYYTITYDAWNYYFVKNYGENLEAAFHDAADNIITKKLSIDDFQNNHSSHESKRRFPNIKNGKRLLILEYTLNKWAKYYDNAIPKEILDQYTRCLEAISKYSRHPISLAYDEKSREITCKKHLKTKEY